MSRTTRLAGAALVAGLALAVSGCSSSGTATGGAAASPAASTPAPGASAPASASPVDHTLTKAALQQALLTSAEVPAGFKASKPDKGEDMFGKADTTMPASCQPIADIAANDAVIRPSAAVDQDYPQPAKASAMIFSRLVSYPAGDAEKAMTALKVAVKSCPTYKSKSPDDGSLTRVRLAVQPGPALGDDAVTLDATGDVQGHALTIRLVDIRIGSSMAVFASFDFKAAKVPAVPQLLMAKQVEKLKAAATG
ncbi:hypothetical protein ABZ468_41740 [Streptomyces sp. NPDC005708]|uniref:hypothetical protein n=1 Tax=Streptomyces sp. NPDC005708 TaxID=3154564 RepID=UPI003409D3C2